ncbi:MAG: hypothetical protein K0S39_2442 [Paenibacillus sp.]|jgi:hypothetical protein|nr:hypothetical protein [Paenibacillus sp.]
MLDKHSASKWREHDTTEEPGIALTLDPQIKLTLPRVRAGFSSDGRLVLQVGSDFLIGNQFLTNILETIIANESFVYMYLNDDVLSLCKLLLQSELNILSERLREHYAETIGSPFFLYQHDEKAKQMSLAAASVCNDTNKELLISNLYLLLVKRFGLISDSGKCRNTEYYNKSLEIVDKGTSQTSLKVTIGEYNVNLDFHDSHFKVVDKASGRMVISDNLFDTSRTITMFERIIPGLGIHYAVSQVKIILLRLGWGYENLKEIDRLLEEWILDVTARSVPTKRMPSETTILYFIKATLPDGSEVNGMWPNTLSAELFYNLESGRVERYVSEQEHCLVLKDGRSYSIFYTEDGGVAVRADSGNSADSGHTLNFYNDTSAGTDKGLLLADSNSVSLLGKINNTASHFSTTHLRAPKGKEFKVILWGSNNFDAYLVEERQGGVRTYDK